MENKTGAQFESDLGRVLEEIELRVGQGDLAIGGEEYKPINEYRTHGELRLYVASPSPISDPLELDDFLAEMFPEEKDNFQGSRVNGDDVVLGRIVLSEVVGKRTSTVSDVLKPPHGILAERFPNLNEGENSQNEIVLRRKIEIIAFPSLELAQTAGHPRADVSIKEGVIDRKFLKESGDRELSKLIHKSLGGK